MQSPDGKLTGLVFVAALIYGIIEVTMWLYKTIAVPIALALCRHLGCSAMSPTEQVIGMFLIVVLLIVLVALIVVQIIYLRRPNSRKC